MTHEQTHFPAPSFLAALVLSLSMVHCSSEPPPPASVPGDTAPAATAAPDPATTATAEGQAPALSPAAATVAAVAAATAAAAVPSAPAAALDLSSADKARATIHEVLKRGDKEAFKKCVTKRILERQSAGGGFDAWFDFWKAAADKTPGFKGIVVAQEDGLWKLDEN